MEFVFRTILDQEIRLTLDPDATIADAKAHLLETEFFQGENNLSILYLSFIPKDDERLADFETDVVPFIVHPRLKMEQPAPAVPPIQVEHVHPSPVHMERKDPSNMDALVDSLDELIGNRQLSIAALRKANYNVDSAANLFFAGSVTEDDITSSGQHPIIDQQKELLQLAQPPQKHQTPRFSERQDEYDKLTDKQKEEVESIISSCNIQPTEALNFYITADMDLETAKVLYSSQF